MTERINVPFWASGQLTPISKDVLREAARLAVGEGRIRLVPAEEGERFLGLGVETEDGVRTLSPYQMGLYPEAHQMVRIALLKFLGLLPVPTWNEALVSSPDEVLYLDIETHGTEDRWRMKPNEFFRLGQWAWGDGPVQTTTSYAEMIDQIISAPLIVGHNIHSFDLSVLFGKDSTFPLTGLLGKVLDTMVYASQVLPAPDTYTNRSGRTMIHGQSPRGTMGWLGLDNLCYQLGLDSKEGDLKALAAEFDGFGNIPIDDPRFVAYAKQDIESLRELTAALLAIRPYDPFGYDAREQKVAAIMAQISRNGFQVDVPAAQARRDALADRKAQILSELQEKYDFPTEGTMPWRTNPGKAAIFKILEDNGITPMSVPTWTRTKTGNLSLGGQTLIEITAGTPAEPLGQALAEVMGQRSLAQLTLDCVQPDGKVHPEVSAFQRSGRWSTTEPGLTVWTSRGDGSIEKSYYVPDSDEEVLVEFDYSAADSRIVAGYSGDMEFAKRFDPGVDSHEMTGRVVFGDKVYDSDPKHYRFVAKTLGHAYAYRAGPKKLSASSGQPLDIAEQFVYKMQRAYPLVTRWQDRVTELGESGWITNAWGRRMVVEQGRSYTQAPALLGQSGTREILVDGLLRMLEFDPRLIRWIKVQVHDALVFSIPNPEIEWAVPKIRELMSTTWNGVDFVVEHGEPSQNWMEASHG